MTPSPVLRFAPSPNGPLHLGHALSALVCSDAAERLGGQLLLRIEDIDIGRCREEHISGILEDLAWLGLTWDGPVLRQSQQFAVYSEAAQRLEGQGLLYPCFASRSEIWEAAEKNALDPDGAPLYPWLHKSLSKAEIEERIGEGQAFALRLDMVRALNAAKQRLGGQPLTFTEIDEDGQPKTIEARPEQWGDAVIIRKDVPASYHLAVVIDDARQGVTHVTRGRDLFAATDLHRLLQVLLGLQEPLYHHHRLLTDKKGRKLSKSAGDAGLSNLRARGVPARDIRGLVSLG
ncbi:MAG: tRNA glutamyl-Q(34) synthetase GluQRS [Hyphomicrobium sp.]